MRYPRHLLLCLALLLVGLGACDDLREEETYYRPDGEGPWVLVDLFHSRKQNPEDYYLHRGNYDYQGVFGYRRAFDHLETHGYRWTSIRSLRLSPQRLAGFDVLFINLVDNQRPAFSASEIEAIQDFVRRGGGLFVIADHTNVYRHAERVNPLLRPMGIEVLYHTAVDYPPAYSVAGTAWIMAFDLDEHPVTADVEMVSMQTGGALATNHGVVHTSARSFADWWNPEDTSGYYGNWTHDGDDNLEPRGPLPIVAAREFGEGRVVVAADQNMFGDAWLHFGDNFALFNNAMEWLAAAPSSIPLRDRSPSGHHIALDLDSTNYRVGRNGNSGYYNFFVHLNRDREVTAHASTGIDYRADTLIFLTPSESFEQAELSSVRDFLESGGQVVVSIAPDAPSAASIQLVEALAPDFTLAQPGGVDGVALSDLSAGNFPSVSGTLSLRSGEIEVSDLKVAAGESSGEGFYRATRSAWGDSLLAAESGIDLARVKGIGDGRLIILLQDEFWQNRTLGNSEVDPPTPENADAIELIYRFLHYLKSHD